MSSAPITITVSMDPELPAFDRHGEPVAIGVALPRGQVSRSDGWSLTDAAGADVPVQTTTLDRWGDGSVRWQLVEFHASVAAGAAAAYALQSGATLPTPTRRISVEHAGENLLVATGAARFSVPRSGAALFADVQVGGLSILDASSIDAEDADGRRYRFITRRATVERAGTLRAVLHLDSGLEDADGVRWLDATVRLHFVAGLGSVRIELSVTNTRAATHAGGRWDLGDPGSVLLRDLSVVLARRVASPEVSASLDRDELLMSAGGIFGLYQDSSGGERWRHANHVNRDGIVPTAFQGYRAWRGAELSGRRATPVVSSGTGDERLTIAMRQFWETFPKALEADSERSVIGVLPRHFSDAHELQGGERMSSTFAVCFGPDTVSADPLFWIRSPLRVTADPASYQRAGMCAPLARGSRASHERYDQLVAAAAGAADSFRQRREIIDEYGWRNFGEIYADHESVGAAEPVVSHYNNQYDAIGGLATRFLQTGDHRWWTLADDLAAHVADIDLYHTHDDRAAYNGGYFRPTQHYLPAQTATHRAYSKRAANWGGGPSNEHNYTSGLMLHYFLTGSESSRAAVLQLADWVLDMDDGAKSRFRWIDRRETGLASGTRSFDFHGPGRGAANSINALLDAHRLTGAPRYLDKADRLIARCVHPSDDPAEIDPLDAENRWSYTVFLQTLGKYLEYRADRELVDDRFEYARAVLLRWARWMCVNERPYLDRPERLESPHETWPAQDLRKAAVFEFAARHTQDDGDYASFLARADGFVDYVMATLAAMPTSRLARPVVLLLAYGIQRPLVSLPSCQL